ncbi:MAG: GyrI-like domain-containing protein [Cyclobacteriaceae bacterium]
MIKKLNLEKSDRNYYQAGLTPEIRDLDVYYYLTVSGRCAPEDQVFLEAIEALYKVAYAVKFRLKNKDQDFVVPKMEGFWWLDKEIKDIDDFKKVPRSEWNWKIMIRLPDFVEKADYEISLALTLDKNEDRPLLNSVKYEKIHEGLCAQILHIGSYEEEDTSLMKLYDFIEKSGYRINNQHHEIYLSDPRRTPEHKLRTILRYGIE